MISLRNAVKFALLGLFLGTTIATVNASAPTVTSDRMSINVDNTPVSVTLPDDGAEVIPVTITASVKSHHTAPKAHKMNCSAPRAQLQGPVTQTVTVCQ